MYRSTDGGETWTYLGLHDTRSIGRVVLDPADPNIAYVAAVGNLWRENPERGVYKTTDAGRTWTKVLFVERTSRSTAGFSSVITEFGILKVEAGSVRRSHSRASLLTTACCRNIPTPSSTPVDDTLVCPKDRWATAKSDTSTLAPAELCTWTSRALT